MKFESFEQVQHIGQIIRSVAQAQSERFFKSGMCGAERTAIVFEHIENEIKLALYDGGYAALLTGIDASEPILTQLSQDGYDISLVVQALADQEEEEAWEDRPCW